MRSPTLRPDRRATMTNTSRDRAIGALVGLAVGDAVGTTLEFRSPGSFTPIDDMTGGGPFELKPGQWTDDTSMAMCLAESILDTDDFDPADQLRRYVAWKQDGYWSSTGRCFDIGGTTRKALNRFAGEGTITDAVVDPEAAANGSLMRLAPVPIRWFNDPMVAAERSAESSRTTHPADRPVDACRVYGAMIAALVGGAAFGDVVAPDFWTGSALDARVDAVVRGSWRDKQPPTIRGTGYVVDALEAAMWAVAGATDFREAILRAANLGNDADTTAAIAGQLAGARWGVSGIPADWRRQISFGDRIEAIAGALHDRAAGSVPDGPWGFDGVVHGYWIDPGRILAGEYPGDRDPQRATEKISLLIDNGIRTFVDLTDDPHLVPYDATLDQIGQQRALSLERLHCPITDMGTIELEGYQRIVDTIHSAAKRGGVYFHCWGGIGRTGTVAGCLLVRGGLDAGAALARIDELRSVTRKASYAAPQTAAQRQVIADFAKLEVT